MRQVHKAGEKLFVDYSGLTMEVIDPKTGEISKAEVFVTALGASGYSYAEASMSQKKHDFMLLMSEPSGSITVLQKCWSPII